jgi:BirA family transcriptional regulator, biotin operon repressor / biotin---[acetyl-CoA-carboxylase] ligase
MRLDPAAEEAGYRLKAHETLPSTNAEALLDAIAHPFNAEPLWITARQQTAGRGRRGNSWVSPVGNLYATLLLKNPSKPQLAPQLSFVAAVAVHDAILDRAPALRPKLTCKWPNDTLCAGAKVAGILIESHEVDGFNVAIGVGVNCVDHPVDVSHPAIDLARAGVAVSADDLFVALSRAMMRRLDQWRSGDGFSAVRSDWIDRAAGIGGEMQVRLPDRALFGRWEALDESGCLLLRLADGTLERIAAGDVFPMGGGTIGPEASSVAKGAVS